MMLMSKLLRITLGLVAASMIFVFVPVAMAGLEVQKVSVSATNRDGSPDAQAGSHPFQLTTDFTLSGPEIGSVLKEPSELLTIPALKDVKVQLPPGFVGNPEATPKCHYQEFIKGGPGGSGCPNDTVVGYETTYFRNNESELGKIGVIFASNPVYNIEPSPGIPAEFGFKVKGFVPVFLDVSVRTGDDYGLTVDVRNITQLLPIYESKVRIWGIPADPSHDSLRGGCVKEESEGESNGNCPVDTPVHPFLMNPTSCGIPRSASIGVDSWQEPGVFSTESVSMPELSGCEKLDFSPTIQVVPDGTSGSTPTGLNVNLHIPQGSLLNPAGLDEANVKNTKVVLPEGVELSPSAADGLEACSPEQIGLHENSAPTCPDASKVATVEIVTPLLPEALTGEVYLATQDNNPFGSLIALYLVAEDKNAGVLVKLAGETVPDPVTGQLTTTFEETPQLPFSDLKLSFFGTARAPLSTPPQCGTYPTETTMEPWSGTPAVHPTSSFQIAAGPGGSPCQSPQPFSPGFVAGSTNLQAGAFTPFTLTMTRPDADQELGRIEMNMPPGLLGTLSATKLCEEPEAQAGTCGPESLIGTTIVSAGLGNDPYTVTGGKVYITTAYGGGQYGLSIVNPAVAGPFNLGIVVVRAAIFVDKHTAALRIVSDPLPTRIDGIPLQIQHVNVSVNREHFTFNPTNCNPHQITATLISSHGTISPASSPFQVTNCGTLAFKPKFQVSTSGRTNRANGASLHVKLSYPASPFDANIAKVKVDLPKQLPSRLTTLQKACPAATFEANPAACPPASIVGHAHATTPVLPVSLEGPAYFVSHGGEEFPNLIIVLQGYGTTVDLVGSTFINSKTNITSSTFKTVPDVPVGTFELTLPQGKYSALAAIGNLCTTKLEMPTSFLGQNGAEIHQSTPIGVTGCAKHATKKKGKKTRGRHKGHVQGKK
jgi:hypothetical protein